MMSWMLGGVRHAHHGAKTKPARTGLDLAEAVELGDC